MTVASITPRKLTVLLLRESSVPGRAFNEKKRKQRRTNGTPERQQTYDENLNARIQNRNETSKILKSTCQICVLKL